MFAICRHNNAATTVQKLHDKLAAYMWECHGWKGLGQVSQHYIRGKDMTGFAAGMRQAPMTVSSSYRACGCSKLVAV